MRVWENIGCVASVSSRVIARKLEISSQRSRRTRAETLATQARENTSRSGEVEETFTVILKNASPPPPHRRRIQATPFLSHFRDPPGLPGENDILHLRETTNQVLVPNMVNQHPL